jgi:uncharacterized protein
LLPLHTLTTLVGLFVAGATSGATGIAFPLIAGPIFLMSYRPAEAVALTALCSLAGQVLSIALLRRRIAYEYRLSLILPGLIGVPLGSTMLDVCSPSLIHLSLGALIAVAGIWGLLQPTTRPAHSLGGTCEALVGAVGGLTAGLVGASAVAPRHLVRMVRSRQGTTARDHAALHPDDADRLVCGACHRGRARRSLARDLALMLAPVLAGVGIGVACFHAFSSATITRSVLALVTASGLALLFA